MSRYGYNFRRNASKITTTKSNLLDMIPTSHIARSGRKCVYTLPSSILGTHPMFNNQLCKSYTPPLQTPTMRHPTNFYPEYLTPMLNDVIIDKNST